MKKLIKNGDIILDGTLTREEKTKEAFKELEKLQKVLIEFEIEDSKELNNILNEYADQCSYLICVMAFFQKKGLLREFKEFLKEGIKTDA